MKSLIHKIIIKILFIFLLTQNLSAQENLNDRAKWFVDARFGMFIHWGVYSGAEGFWKGERLRHGNNYAEWIQYRNRISREEYLSLLENFDWNQIDPEEWVILAKKAGMKYVTITAKHHDGFALWDSKVNDYDVTDQTNGKRDIIKEIAEACQKHGLKLGLYYSHWIDWDHPDSWDHSKEVTGLSEEDYDVYWQEKVIPQMRELLTNYGPIGLIWFDMWEHHSDTVVTKEQLMQLKSLIRTLQPDTLINSRLGLSVEEDSDVDFQTLLDNEFGEYKKEHPWQTSGTVSHSWGYHSDDSEWKSTTTLIKSLINNVSLNGNFQLNIGPRADGSVTYEMGNRLLEMGSWLSENGEAIYGTSAFDLHRDQHDWGDITYRNENEVSHKLYLHIYNWPLDRKITLTGIKNSPSRIYSLSDKSKTPVSFKHSEVVTHINLPPEQPNKYSSVMVVEYDKKPSIVLNLVAQSVSDGYSFTPHNWHKADGNTKLEERARYNTIPEHVIVKENSSYSWNVYIDKPGTYKFDNSYSFQNDNNFGSVKIEAAGKTITHTVRPTGKTVGEPISDWVIDDYEASTIGTINFPEPGYYKIDMDISPKNDTPIMFQWGWMEKVE